MPRVVILGGGVSGLATAHYLLQQDSDLELLLVESEARLGGTMGTENEGGFRFERGPNGFLDNVPETLDLVESLGLSSRLTRASSASEERFIYARGRLLALPKGALAFLFSPVLSLRGKLRAMLEPFQPPRLGDADESVASFGRRRLGDEVVRMLLDPFVTGIHAADVERLSMPSAFPKLVALESEYGGLIKALRARRREQKRKPAKESAGETRGGSSFAPRGTLTSFPGGMQELVDALAESIGEDRIRLDWKAQAVRRQGKGFVIEGPGGDSEATDGVVLAVPSYRSASLLAATEPETSRALEAIPYAPIAVLCFGHAREQVSHPLDGFGFLAPRHQGVRMLGSIWVSSIFPDHAPDGTVSLRCMIGGAHDPDALNLTRERLAEVVLDELAPILGLGGEPIVQRVFRYARGIPQYNLGHKGRVERIERQLWNLPGLFIAGNAYHGVSVNDCVKEAKRKARAVLEYFR